MMPDPELHDTFEKRFRDLQLSYVRSKKHIMFIAVMISGVVAIIVLSFVLKDPVESIFDVATNPDENGPKMYLVHTPTCRIPSYEPYNDDFMQFYKANQNLSNEELGSCGTLPLLTSITLTGETHTLRINKEYIANYSTFDEEFTCCYSYVFNSALLYGEEENATVDEPKLLPCKEFNDSVTLEKDFEFVRVACGNNKSSSMPPTNVYQHFHSYVSFKREVKVKIGLYHETIRLAKKFKDVPEVSPWEKPWSVMIVGIDAVSRLNLLRMMPKTASYLEESGWFPLQGFNKVGDNTFPNLAAAALAGSTEEQLKKTCAPTSHTPVDWCPWIWGKFSAQGYITALGEDISRGDTFYLNTGGFRHPPTDYFLRTLLKAADDHTKHDWYEKFIQNNNDCFGKLHESEYIMKFSLEFAETLKNYPTFSVFWLNSFSHDNLFRPKAMDEYFRSYLQNLTASINDSVVVFMSDHGMAYGPYREREMGSIETNLPFVYFWLPDSFKKLNPGAVQNLVENKHKLTSHFDLHLTFLDLLGDGSKAPGCPTCTSLFKPVSTHRTCSHAGIPIRYCACTQYAKVSNTSSLFRDVGEFLVLQLNRMANKSQGDVMLEEFKCAVVSLKNVISMKKVISKVDDIYLNNTSSRNGQFFLVSIETEPKAVFEAMIFKNDSMHIVDSITRIDSYHSTSHCLWKPEYKPYCICETRNDVIEKFKEMLKSNEDDVVTPNRFNTPERGEFIEETLVENPYT